MKKALSLSLLAAAAMLPFGALADKPLSKGDVEGIIKQYLGEHPEVIIDSVKKYQQKQMEDEANKSAAALKDKKADLTQDKNSPVAGNPQGDVTVVEFFDYHCGYCKKMLPAVTNLIKQDPKLRVTFKEFPILSEDSETASRASLAFAKLKPEQYLAYHTVLMGMSGKFDEDTLIAEAKKLGADEAAMKKEMHADWVGEELKKTKDLAEALYIRGTPAFVIGDMLIPGAAGEEDLKKAIDQARHPEPKKADKKAKAE